MSKKNKKKPLTVAPLSLKNYIIQHARKLPIYKVLEQYSPGTGIKQIIVARMKKNGQLIIGFYLIDLFCLGLKNTFFAEMDGVDSFNEKFLETEYDEIEFEEIEPNLAFNYIYGAIEYAEDIAFKPHKDFAITEFILEDVGKIDFVDIEFGHQGKPFFIAGPDDKKGVILAHLDKHVGEGNYEYVVNIEDDNELDDNELDEDDIDEESNLFQSDYEEELDEFRNMDRDEFKNHLEGIIENLPKSQLSNYLLAAVFTMSVNEIYDNYEKLLKDYRKNPDKVLTELKKYNKKTLTKLEEQDIDENHVLIKIAVENYLQFGGPEFLCLDDFITALNIFENKADELNEELAEIYRKFIIPLEIKHALNLTMILQAITNELLEVDSYFDLNVFQRNIVANKALELMDQFDRMQELDERWDYLSIFIFDHFDLSDYLPQLSKKELLAKMLNLTMFE